MRTNLIGWNVMNMERIKEGKIVHRNRKKTKGKEWNRWSRMEGKEGLVDLGRAREKGGREGTDEG